MSIEQAEFRQALGSFASGVTVVTTQHQGQLHGTTVSAFSSLSLQPPLVMVGIAHKSAIHDLIVESRVFGVNILAEHGETISRHFARQQADKFSCIGYSFGQLGVPLLHDALTMLECRLSAHYPGGDHSIFVGEVVATFTGAYAQPLLYYRSQYSRLHRDSVRLLKSAM